jgi:hypothetical protein
MTVNSKKNNNVNIVTDITTELLTPVVTPVVTPVKAKRGRKSKKELMAALNMTEILTKEKDNKKSIQKYNGINLNVYEIENNLTEIIDDGKENNVYEDILGDENNISMQTNSELSNIISSLNVSEEPKIAKKRGRKPKGGKIIQQISTNVLQQEEKTNVILHLKCSMKDLQTYSQNNSFVQSYNFSNCKNDLTYELIGNGNENINTIDKSSTSTTLDIEYDGDDYDDDESVCKDTNKELCKKLKQLEHNLHINNVNNKRSACFWDTCEFDNPPIYIPKHFINGTYHVYGCFCSPECGVAYLMNENIDSSTKFERYHLFNHIYTKIYDYKKNIKPAPNPYYMLDKFYGNLSIQEYRSLLRNERLFLIVDKPLTRILPELHEDNDEFILNNKIIPSNNYNVKTRLQRKKQNKNLILTEKFGNNNYQ